MARGAGHCFTALLLRRQLPRPHARLSREELSEFVKRFPDAYAKLRAADRVVAPKRDGYTGIRTAGLREWVEKYLSAAIPLMQNYTTPVRRSGRASPGNPPWERPSDNTNDHLKRSKWSLQFCAQQHWTFPEGCPYGKPDEPEYPEGFLDGVVEHVKKQLLAG